MFMIIYEFNTNVYNLSIYFLPKGAIIKVIKDQLNPFLN